MTIFYIHCIVSVLSFIYFFIFMMKEWKYGTLWSNANVLSITSVALIGAVLWPIVFWALGLSYLGRKLMREE